MKLYEVPRNSWVKLDDGKVIFFEKADGVYSRCWDGPNRLIHLSAVTEVEVLTHPPKEPA